MKRKMLTSDEEKQLRDCELKYGEALSLYMNSNDPSEEDWTALLKAEDELTKMYKNFGISYEEQAVQ